MRYLNTKGRLRTSSKYAQLASEIFMEQSGRSSDGYGKANLRLAKNQMAIKKYRKAIPYLKMHSIILRFLNLLADSW